MKRLTTTEISLLILALVLLSVGLCEAISPSEIRTIHPGTGGNSLPALSSAAHHEFVTRGEMRIYGCLSIGLGAAIIWFVCIAGKK